MKFDFTDSGLGFRIEIESGWGFEFRAFTFVTMSQGYKDVIHSRSTLYFGMISSQGGQTKFRCFSSWWVLALGPFAICVAKRVPPEQVPMYKNELVDWRKK